MGVKLVETRSPSFRRRRNDRLNLDTITLDIEAGETLCILGPNGAGKCTLIGCLLGLVEGSTGSVALSGRSIEALSREDIARLVAYVPQSSELVFAYSVRQMVLMGRTTHFGRGGAPGSTDRLRVEQALVSCKIAHLGDRPFVELSGGERQLVLIARALAQDAPLLVMDEPTAGLDLGSQGRVLGLVRELSRAGKGVIMTSDMPEHAFVLACRVALLKDG